MRRALLLRATLAALALLGLMAAASAAGLRINLTPSVPRGVYLRTAERPVRGGYVAVCPPPGPVFAEARARGYLPPGWCAGNYGELIKVLAAGPGDTVRIDESGVQIGDRLWPASAPVSADPNGRAMPRPPAVTARLENSAVVMSQNCELGFDSRYFGPVPMSAIQAALTPVWTW